MQLIQNLMVPESALYVFSESENMHPWKDT